MAHPLGHVGLKFELTIPKCLDRGLEYSCPVHKSPRLESNLTWRRGFLAFGGWHDISSRGKWGTVSEELLTGHLIRLNLERPCRMASTVEIPYRFNFFIFFKTKTPFVFLLRHISYSVYILQNSFALKNPSTRPLFFHRHTTSARQPGNSFLYRWSPFGL